MESTELAKLNPWLNANQDLTGFFQIFQNDSDSKDMTGIDFQQFNPWSQSNQAFSDFFQMFNTDIQSSVQDLSEMNMLAMKSFWEQQQYFGSLVMECNTQYVDKLKQAKSIPELFDVNRQQLAECFTKWSEAAEKNAQNLTELESFYAEWMAATPKHPTA